MGHPVNFGTIGGCWFPPDLDVIPHETLLLGSLFRVDNLSDSPSGIYRDVDKRGNIENGTHIHKQAVLIGLYRIDKVNDTS